MQPAASGDSGTRDSGTRAAAARAAAARAAPTRTTCNPRATGNHQYAMCHRGLIYRLLAATWVLFACLGAVLALVPPAEWGSGGFLVGLLHGLVQWCLVAAVAMLTICFGRLFGEARRMLAPPRTPQRAAQGPRLPW